MNEINARERGYRYTGFYSRSHDEMIEKRDSIRVKGYKAVLVTIPDNPLSRGIVGVGYSVYVDSNYVRDERIKDLTNRLAQIPGERAFALKEYNEVVAKIDAQQKWIEEDLAKNLKEKAELK
jgi:hypothetical protein